MTTATANKEERLLDRVRKLLDLAEHPNTPEAEADTAREMANRLMVRHAIDDAMLRAAMPENERRKPVDRVVDISYDLYELAPYLRSVLQEIAEGNRCRAIRINRGIHIFGFQDDVDWVEMLYTAAYAALVTYLHPKWDTSKGYDENVYNFKVAGYAWKDIDAVAVKYGGCVSAEVVKTEEAWDYYTERWIYREVPTGKMGGRLIAAYKRHAKAVGDTSPVSTQSFEHFRRSYAEGFVQRLGHRLYLLNQQQKQEVASSGAELVLFDALTAVQEALFQHYPNMRPMTAEEREERRRILQQQQAEELRRRNEMLDAMTEKQRAAFLEKEERKRERDWARWNNQDNRDRTDYSALDRGSKAADRVNINRSTRVEKQERGQIGG